MHITDPSQFNQLKRYDVFTYNCRKCGNLQTRKYRPENLNDISLLLCVPCLREHKTGYRTPFADPKIQEQVIQHNIETLGVAYPLQSQEIHDKISASNIANFGNACTLHDGGECEAKAKKSTMEHLGVEYALQNPDIYQKTQDTMVARHGTRFSLQVPEFKAKQEATLESNFGVTNPMQNPELLAKANATKQNTYGNMNNCEKGIATRIERYGSNFNNNPYYYYNLYFDSSWELAVWMYYVDHNIPIVREPVIFRYSDNAGKIFPYIPDFKINGQLVEVKGDQFFDETGKMVCPYRERMIDGKWVKYTDDELEYLNDKTERKHQCGLSNGVIFWTSKDVKKYLDYCDLTYPGWQYTYRRDNPYNPSYWVGYVPIVQQNNGITPYDCDMNEKYAPISGQGVTPFDIK